MDTDQNRVIVTEGATAHTTGFIIATSRRSRPTGRSTKEAASFLANKLSLALDTALTDWRRQTLSRRSPTSRPS